MRNEITFLATVLCLAAAAPAAEPPKAYVNSLGTKFVLIPAGEFVMGSPNEYRLASGDEAPAGGEPAPAVAKPKNPPGRLKVAGERKQPASVSSDISTAVGLASSDARGFPDDEQPQRKVAVVQPYYLAAHETTQAEWKAVMGTEPWSGGTDTQAGPDFAVNFVNWDGATEFCRKLSEKEGKKYRLPTEIEWEYACRAGTTTLYSFGDDEERLTDYCWFGGYAQEGNVRGERYAHEVGKKRPNPWGLYDMHGNVSEWCSDWYDPNYYSKPATEPQASADPRFADGAKIVRGGAWLLVGERCRSGCRSAYAQKQIAVFLGFRIVVEP